MKNHQARPGLLRFIGKVLLALSKLLTFLIVRKILMHKQVEVRTEEKERSQAQQNMNEFLSLISHELKTPLTSIKGNIQLLSRMLKSSLNTNITQSEDMQQRLKETRDLLERTDQQITRLTRLVNVFLENARIYGNSMDLLFDLCDLDTLVREVVEDRRILSPTRTIQLELPSEQAVLVMADTTRVKQVVIHFLSNAHKFSSLNRPIEVRLWTEGKMARVSVHDYGQGIHPEEQQHVWERFYRVPDIKVLSGTEVGLGLGLYISRRIIELHHGQVGLRSEPGEGSTFWFMLPLLEKSLESQLLA